MANNLEQLYPYVPVCVQNAGISLFGLFWRQHRLGGHFREHTAGFQERETWHPERFNAYVEARLRTTVTHAYTQVPYYRRHWAGLAVTDDGLSRLTLHDLAALPITPKSHLRESPDSFLAADVRAREKLYRYYSSGSTGTPITAICTADSHRRFLAAREARSFGWAGASILQPRSMIGGRLVLPRGSSRGPFHRYNWAEKQVYLSAYHISAANAPAYVKALNFHRPEVFTGYAYSHFILARMMVEHGLTLDYKPRALVLGSEKLTSEMKSVIRQAFGARAYEEYGAVENCMLGTECEYGRLHVHPDFGIVEIVDPQGRAVHPGVEGRILCTGLQNDAQPLIRYEIGDLGVWDDRACACGRNHLPVLKEVVGRLEDIIEGPDGRQLVRFHGIFVGLTNVLEGQVVQKAPDRFTVRIVASSEFGSSEETTIRKRFEERLGRVSVEVQKVDAIPKNGRGKFRAVIRDIE